MRTLILIMLLVGFVIGENSLGRTTITDTQSGGQVTCHKDLYGNLVCQ